MTTFSAWSFTGGAGKAYETGTFFLLLFACNIVSLIFTYFFTAGDVVQMLVVLSATIAMSVFVLTHDQVGGLSGLIEKVPPSHFNWTEFDRGGIIWIFAITLLINQTIQGNGIQTGAAKYIFVKNGRDAQKAVLISIAGFALLSPIWIIPAMAATIFHPNLAAEYPLLNNPNEAAYIAMAIDMLPPGMLGLLVCAIFAASITSLNSMLNMVSGVCVRSFYIRIIDKDCSEAKQILIGRIVIVVYSLSWILVGLAFSQYKDLSLFDLILTLAACIGIPTTIPLFFGIDTPTSSSTR